MAFLYIFKNDFLMQVALKCTYLFGMMPPLFYVIFAYHYPYKFWNYTQFLINIVFITPIILGILFLWGILNLQEAFIQNGVLQQIVHFNSFLIFSIYFFGYILWGLIILIIKIRRDTGFYRGRISYLIIATISTFIVVGIVSIILPLFNNWSYDWLGPILPLIHFLVAGYLLFYKVNKN